MTRAPGGDAPWPPSPQGPAPLPPPFSPEQIENLGKAMRSAFAKVAEATRPTSVRVELNDWSEMDETEENDTGRPARVQYARTTAEAAALIIKNEIDIWAPIDVISDRVHDLALEGPDLDRGNLTGLIRIMRDAELDGADLAERIIEEEFSYVPYSPESRAAQEAEKAEELAKARAVLFG